MQNPVKTCWYLIIVVALTVFSNSEAQSYRIDSLQIKAYTVIKYRNNEVKDIELLKVLCDYCSQAQSKALGNEAIRRTYLDRNLVEHRMENGDKKLAIFIRIAKADLEAIKELPKDIENKYN